MALSASAPRPPPPTANRLLAAVPPEEFARLQPHLELSPLYLGWAVYESGGRQGYVYFPIDAIVSLLYVMEGGASAEIAVIGNDGVVGISCSWAAIPRRAALWCRARAKATGSRLVF
jgi:hypothetical protein